MGSCLSSNPLCFKGAFFRRDMEKATAAGRGSFPSVAHILRGLPTAGAWCTRCRPRCFSAAALFLLTCRSLWTILPILSLAAGCSIFTPNTTTPPPNCLAQCPAYPCYSERSGGLPQCVASEAMHAYHCPNSGQAKIVGLLNSPFRFSIMIGILDMPGNTSYTVKYDTRCIIVVSI